MGGFATLHFGFRHAKLARSLVVGGCGYGAEPGRREVFRGECEATAKLLDEKGSAAFAAKYALGAARVQYQNKDPRGWQEFATQLAEHSAKGSANTMRGVQLQRPSLWELVESMKKLTIPVAVVIEEGATGAPARLVIPQSGHTINLEEPEAFNRAVAEFLHAVENGRWGSRDPRSVTSGVLGLK